VGSHVAEPIVCGPKLHEGITGPMTRITALETLAQVRLLVEGTIYKKKNIHSECIFAYQAHNSHRWVVCPSSGNNPG
jgi:hypothetical protein